MIHKTVYFINARAIPSSIVLNFKGCKFQLNQKSSLHIQKKKKNGLFEHVGNVYIEWNQLYVSKIHILLTFRNGCVAFHLIFFIIKKLHIRFLFNLKSSCYYFQLQQWEK